MSENPFVMLVAVYIALAVGLVMWDFCKVLGEDMDDTP